MALPAANLKLKYEVENAPSRTVKRRFAVKEAVIDKDGKTRNHLKFEVREVTLDHGFMVYFPAGHSIFVDDAEALAKLGLDGSPPVVDMNTGEEMQISETFSPKQVVERSTRTKGR